LSYQVLARKWRPHSFADLVGQDHVRQALTNSRTTGRLHHAYLFTGTRGVGKITIARLLAKALNCEQGVSAEPCGQCGACNEIDEGRFLDLLEIDAASRTKVDDTRDLLENVQYAPTRGRFKIYLIDEVHMFSKSSFNALLKTLEEPPAHVKFLLATTDPQKIPVTILSRCLQFNLRQMPAEVIEQQLIKITASENLQAESEALRLLARSAAGSMRDGLSLLDQAIAFCGTDLTLADTAGMLGAVDHGQVVEMLLALHRGDANELLGQVESLAARAVDYSAILEEVLSLLHALSVRQQVEDAPVQVEVPTEQLASLAALIPAEELQLYYQLGLHGRRDLPLAPTPRIGLEMALLRMLAFQPERSAAPVEFAAPVADSRESNTTTAVAQTKENAKSVPVPEIAAEPVPKSPDQQIPLPESPAPGTRTEEVFESESPAAFVDAQIKEESPPTQVPVASADSLSPVSASSDPDMPNNESKGDRDAEQIKEPTTTKGSGSTDLPDWSQLAYTLSLTGLAQQLAAQLALVGVTDREYQFTLDTTHRAVLNRAAQSRLEQALCNHLDQPIKVVIEVVRHGSETPAMERQRAEQQRLDEVTHNLQEDPTVKALEGTFGARLDAASIEPLEPESP